MKEVHCKLGGDQCGRPLEKVVKTKKGKNAMFDNQTKKFCAAVIECLPFAPEEVMQGWITNPNGLKKVLKEALCPPEEALPATDPIIRVDRGVRPQYPDWVKDVMYPELESTGPTEYSISAVEQWLHDGQKGGGWVEGKKIYDHLKKNDMLKSCLGLRDLEEIQKKEIAFFCKHFQGKGKAVFGWKGVVRDRDGRLSVPCLYDHGGVVVLVWYWLGDAWRGRNPALRLASSAKD